MAARWELSAEWRAWLAENALSGTPPLTLVEALVAGGVPKRVARREVAEMLASPLFARCLAAEARSRRLELVAKLLRTAASAAPSAGLVERRTGLGAGEVMAQYLSVGRPVVLTDWLPAPMDKWLAHWSPSSLAARFGHVPIEIMVGDVTDRGLRDRGPASRTTLPLATFVEGLASPAPTQALEAYNRALELPELRVLLEELPTESPLFAGLIDTARLDGGVSLWCSPAGQFTPLHYDTTDILFCQMHGKKRLSLVSPLATSLLGSLRGMWARAPLDELLASGEHPDLAPLEVELSPGEALVLPGGTWHEVHTLTTSVHLSVLPFRHGLDLGFYRPALAPRSRRVRPVRPGPRPHFLGFAAETRVPPCTMAPETRLDLRFDAARPRALVLSGGGARGAFQVGVWEVLARDPRGFGRLPEIVSGTSAGAINAYLLACGLGPEDMLAFWLDLAKDPPVVANERFFRSLTNSLLTLLVKEPLRGPGRRLRELSILKGLVGKHPLRRASGLEAAILEFFLTARFDSVSYLLERVETPFLFDASPLADRLRQATKGRKPDRTRLAINSVDAQTGSVIRFVNHEPVKRDGSSAAHYRVVNEITPEMVLASASIPLLFNPVPIGGRSYWDGGLLVNTPLAPSIALGASRVVPVLVTPKRRESAPLETAGNGLERLVDTFLENAYQIDRKLLLDRNALAARDETLRTVALFHAIRPQSGRTFDAGSYLYFEKTALLAMYDEGKRAAAAWLASGPEVDTRRLALLPSARRQAGSGARRASHRDALGLAAEWIGAPYWAAMKREGSSRSSSVPVVSLERAARRSGPPVAAKASPKPKKAAKAASDLTAETKTVKVPVKASHDTGTPENLIAFMLTSWKPAAGKLPAPIAHHEAFERRRRALSAKFPGEILIIPTGHEKVRANDTHFRFRPGSDFYYLTGNIEPDCVLVMLPKGRGKTASHDDVLYVEPNPGRSSATFYTDRNKGELWVGPRLGVKESQARFRTKRCESLADLPEFLAKTAKDHPGSLGVRVLRGFSPKVDRALPLKAKDVRDRELASVLSELRLLKDEVEIKELSRVIAATKRGFEDVIRSLGKAKTERVVEGVFGLRARVEGNDVGYGTIAAAGHHACTLHWTRNDGPLTQGDLLLLDAGIEGNSLYTADITRSLPISGKYTKEQRIIHDLVHRAQAAAFAAVKPGNDFLEPNRAAMRVLADGLADLGILTVSADEALKDENQFYKRYSLHNVSHMLGLDVHDCAAARQETYKFGKLEPGMVLTIEPGLYFQRDDLTVPAKFRGIGVRIEDDVVVTKGGYKNLSADIPSSSDAVESWMAGLLGQPSELALVGNESARAIVCSGGLGWKADFGWYVHSLDAKRARPIIARSMNRSERPPPASGPRLTLFALCATTFFIVSGGPYGLEEIVQGHGYGRAMALLVAVPLVWGLPVAWMVGELSAALPDEGGYYAWVRRGLGPFWGVQEAWLSLAYGLFDMALYPTLFVAYFGRFVPVCADTALFRPGWWCGVAMIAVCALWNLRGAKSVGSGASWLGAALLAPFVVLVAIAAARLPFGGLAAARTAFAETPPTAGSSAFLGGVLLCMWNYMGFDNASTIVTEVSEPQRVYPRAMLGTLALIAGCYLSSVAAASVAGVPLASWTTGAWTTVAERLGGPVLGPVLALAIVLGGAISAFGMFNALLLSASRLPVALAHDGFLPRFVGYASPRTGAPVVAILLSALAYASCLTLGLKRLVQIDVALYGVALLLEFVALVALRLREPELVRPFRVPGGTVAAALLGVPPMALLGTALWMASRADRGEIAAFGLTSFQLAAAVALGGPLLYFVGAFRSRSARSRSASGV